MAGSFRDEVLIPFAHATRLFAMGRDRSSNPDNSLFYRYLFDIRNQTKQTIEEITELPQWLYNVDREFVLHPGKEAPLNPPSPARFVPSHPFLVAGAAHSSQVALLFRAKHDEIVIRQIDADRFAILTEFRTALFFHEMALSGDGSKLAAINADYVAIWKDLSQPEPAIRINHSFSERQGGHYIGWCQGHWVVSSNQRSQRRGSLLRILSEEEGTLLAEIPLAGRPCSLQTAQDAPFVVCGFDNDSVQIINIASSESVVFHPFDPITRYNRPQVAISADGLQVVAYAPFTGQLYAICAGENRPILLETVLQTIQLPLSGDDFLLSSPGFTILENQLVTVTNGELTFHHLPKPIQNHWATTKYEFTSQNNFKDTLHLVSSPYLMAQVAKRVAPSSRYYFEALQKVFDCPEIWKIQDTLFEAGQIFALAGLGDLALQCWTYLLQGPLAQHAERNRHGLRSFFLPLLCWTLQIAEPDGIDQPGRDLAAIGQHLHKTDQYRRKNSSHVFREQNERINQIEEAVLNKEFALAQELLRKWFASERSPSALMSNWAVAWLCQQKVLAEEVGVTREMAKDFLEQVQKWILQPPPQLTTYESDGFGWKPFLEVFSEAIVAKEDSSEVKQMMETTGWLGYPAASEYEIAAAEERLGRRLPPSFREFLKVSNGWPILEGSVTMRLRPVSELAWFREEEAEYVQIWTEDTTDDISDTEYAVYGAAQDCVMMRREYLHHVLQISDIEDSDVILLNPLTQTMDGEWEAWRFGSKLPGAYRYTTFRELIEWHSATTFAATWND